jgi:D-tyrosyl-tRNA(Tyr) deacylase
VQAADAYNAGMQYTLRNIPKKVDQALRRKAKAEGRSLNDVTLEAIEHGLGIAHEPVAYHDLDFLIGTWVEDPEFDAAIKAQNQIDPELWK